MRTGSLGRPDGSDTDDRGYLANSRSVGAVQDLPRLDVSVCRKEKQAMDTHLLSPAITLHKHC